MATFYLVNPCNRCAKDKNQEVLYLLSRSKKRTKVIANVALRLTGVFAVTKPAILGWTPQSTMAHVHTEEADIFIF